MRVTRMLAATTLVLEALVVFFALLVAVSLYDVDAGRAVGAGAALSVGCLLTAGLLRFRWALLVGSVLQLLILATGFVVPMMFFIGAVFAGFWVAALILGRRAERIALERIENTPGTLPS